MRNLARLGVALFWITLTVVLAPTATAAGGESIFGTLQGPHGPVAGVVLTVTQNGKKIGSDTSAKDGTWRVALPRPGTYTVTLDTDTLPKGVVLRTKGLDTLDDVTVDRQENRAVIFPLTTPAEQQAGPPKTGNATPTQPTETETGPFWPRFAQLAVAGIEFGAIIAITAIGLSLIFGTTKMINFAHGEYVTLGAVVAYFFNATASGPGIDLIAAAVIAVALLGVAGGVTELGLWRPLRRRGVGRVQLFIISIGLSLFIRHLILVVYGSRAGQYTDYTLQTALTFGPIAVTPRDIVIVVLSVAALVGVGLMLQRTRIGKAMRAVSDNVDLASASGINVDRVILVVWMLGGALAGLGGVFYGLQQVVEWDMGFRLLLLMFAAVILGGLGTAFGAVVGSFVIGLVAQLSTLWFPIELQNAWALLVMIVVLLFRPQGILGHRERVG